MIGNPVKIVLSRIVNGTIYSHTTVAVGSRYRVNTAVARCQKFVNIGLGSINLGYIVIVILAILNSLRRSKSGRSRKSNNSSRCDH